MSPGRYPDSHPWVPRDTHPRSVLHPEHSGHQILICCARHKLHLHEAILLPAWLWPVLQAGLGHREQAEWSRTSPHPSASSGDSTMAQCPALASPAAHLSLHRSPIRTQGHLPRALAHPEWSQQLHKECRDPHGYVDKNFCSNMLATSYTRVCVDSCITLPYPEKRQK